MSENEAYSSGNRNFFEKVTSMVFKLNQAQPSQWYLRRLSEGNFCMKIKFWIFVHYMFPHVPRHKTTWLWASETIRINTTSGNWDFFKFLWHMDFFMISWKYACFPYYFWKNKNLRLSVRVENHPYIHFLASNKSKLPTCGSRKVIRALTMSKTHFMMPRQIKREGAQHLLSV